MKFSTRGVAPVQSATPTAEPTPPTSVLEHSVAQPINTTPAEPQEKPEAQKPKAKGERRDHRQEMTDLACEHIERGTAPWLTGGGAWPRNGIRGNIYHGINVMNLMAEDPRWCTFNQAKEKGWYVKKGEKSQPLYFFKPLVKEEEQLDGTVETRKIPYLTSYRVFNFSQLDRGNDPDLADADDDIAPLSAESLTEEQRDIIDTIFENADPAIKQASVSGYSPSTDTIFLNTHYASDVDEAVDKIHQLCHWSGGPDRLARNFGESRQSTEYAIEELRACMASTMVCARLGIHHQLLGHDDYGALQVDALRGDKSLIYSIAKDAELICRHVCAFHPELREEMEQEYQQQMAAAVEAGAPAELFDTSDIDFNDPVFDPQQGLKP